MSTSRHQVPSYDLMGLRLLGGFSEASFGGWRWGFLAGLCISLIFLVGFLFMAASGLFSFALSIWFLYRIIKGWVDLTQDKMMFDHLF